MTTRTPGIIATLVMGAVLLAPSAPTAAAVRAADPWFDPSASLVVTGKGYGHGNGMSQHGALGAARQGLNHRQILAFYYPGTTLTTLRGKLRVLITGDTDNNTTVKPARGLRVRDRGNGKAYYLPTTKSPRAWRMKTVDGRVRVYYKTGRWHLYRTGGRVALAGDGEFRSKAGRIRLRLPSGNRDYRGALRHVHRDTVNVLGLQKYLKGVVASEMPALWPTQALRAQSVAARTYAARARVDNARRYYHICDTTACQVYTGYSGEHPNTNAAIDATIGQIVSYAGKPAFAQFSSSSGGWTSAGNAPYLRAKKDVYDTPDVDPHYPWTPTRTIDTARLATRYPAIGKLIRLRISEREGAGDWGGRVETIILDGTTRDLEITGDDFRWLYGLKSTYFKFGA